MRTNLYEIEKWLKKSMKHKVSFSQSTVVAFLITGLFGLGINAYAATRMTGTGFMIDNGPSMTTEGIDAASNKITNVADGESDTDAVNFKQLKAAKADVVNAAVASARTEVKNGKNTAVTKETAKDGHDIYTIDVKGDLEEITSIANGDIKISLNKDSNAVDVNKAKITKVADGDISESSTDAVNGRQLKRVINRVEENYKTLNTRIDDLGDKVNKGLAGAAAMSGLEFMDIGINQATVAAAVGGYKGRQAVAVGMQAAPTENTRINAKVSLTQGARAESLYSVGASYRFDWR